MTFLTLGNILLIGSILLFVSIAVSKTSARFGVPTLLLFLFVGMFAGSDGFGIQFEDMREAQFVGMVSLCIILFSGGMDTKFAEIKPVLSPGLMLSTVGVLLTALLTGGFVWWLSGLEWTNIHFALLPSLLLAATMSSTDSASVFAILRSQNINLKHNLRPMLELESGSNDPMAYMLTIVLLQFVTGEVNGVGNILLSFAQQFAFGGAIGYGIGKVAVYVINRLNIENKSLYSIFMMAICFFTFALTDMLKGNGYLAVYLAGMIIGNSRIANRREVATFFEGLTWLFQIVMFILLGLLVNPHEMINIAAVALLIGAFMILVGRPLSVMISLLPFRNINMRSRLYISWVGLRGAVPIIFATYPVVADIEGSHQIFNIVFFITLLSLMIQGTTLPIFARKLNLSAPMEKTGNDFGVELPEGINTKLTDMVVTEEMIAHGDTLKEIVLPQGSLVMIVKRGSEFLVPNGTLHLQKDDKLLLIAEEHKE